MEAARTILTFVTDVMYKTQIREAANPMGGVVAEVSGIQDGIDKLQQISPSLLILDVSHVPSGWERLIQSAKTQGVPVIAYGSQADESARSQAEAAGCNEVLVNTKFSMDLPQLLNRYL